MEGTCLNAAHTLDVTYLHLPRILLLVFHKHIRVDANAATTLANILSLKSKGLKSIERNQ